MSQTNDFPARADSKPADDTSEEKAGLSIALQGVQCVHLHTQALGLAIQMWCKLQIYVTLFPSWMEK